MVRLLSSLKKAQKIGVVLIILTLSATLFFYNDVYGLLYGIFLGAGIGLLFWSKDPKEIKK